MAERNELLNEEREQERFVAYLDGTMPPEEMGAFESELESDPALQRRFRDYEQATLLIHGLAGEPGIDAVDLLPNLERRMGMRRRSSPNISWRLPIEVGGMLVVMLVAVLFFMHELRRSDQISVPELRPGPVEIFVGAPPSEQVAKAFALSLSQASLQTPPRVWTAMLSQTEIDGLLVSLDDSVTRVRNYPDNPCEPCAVLVFEIASQEPAAGTRP